jgi:hypothetical protein
LESEALEISGQQHGDDRGNGHRQYQYPCSGTALAGTFTLARNIGGGYFASSGFHEFILAHFCGYQAI